MRPIVRQSDNLFRHRPPAPQRTAGRSSRRKTAALQWSPSPEGTGSILESRGTRIPYFYIKMEDRVNYFLEYTGPDGEDYVAGAFPNPGEAKKAAEEVEAGRAVGTSFRDTWNNSDWSLQYTSRKKTASLQWSPSPEGSGSVLETRGTQIPYFYILWDREYYFLEYTGPDGEDYVVGPFPNPDEAKKAAEEVDSGRAVGTSYQDSWDNREWGLKYTSQKKTASLQWWPEEPDTEEILEARGTQIPMFYIYPEDGGGFLQYIGPDREDYAVGSFPSIEEAKKAAEDVEAGRAKGNSYLTIINPDGSTSVEYTSRKRVAEAPNGEVKKAAGVSALEGIVDSEGGPLQLNKSYKDNFVDATFVVRENGLEYPFDHSFVEYNHPDWEYDVKDFQSYPPSFLSWSTLGDEPQVYGKESRKRVAADFDPEEPNDVAFVKEEIEVQPEFPAWFSRTYPYEFLEDYDDESLVGFYNEFRKSSRKMNTTANAQLQQHIDMSDENFENTKQFVAQNSREASEKAMAHTRTTVDEEGEVKPVDGSQTRKGSREWYDMAYEAAEFKGYSQDFYPDEALAFVEGARWERERSKNSYTASTAATEFQVGDEVIWNGDPLLPRARAVIDEIKGGDYYLTIINPDGSTGFQMVEPHEVALMEKTSSRKVAEADFNYEDWLSEFEVVLEDLLGLDGFYDLEEMSAREALKFLRNVTTDETLLKSLQDVVEPGGGSYTASRRKGRRYPKVGERRKTASGEWVDMGEEGMLTYLPENEDLDEIVYAQIAVGDNDYGLPVNSWQIGEAGPSGRVLAEGSGPTLEEAQRQLEQSFEKATADASFGFPMGRGSRKTSRRKGRRYPKVGEQRRTSGCLPQFKEWFTKYYHMDLEDASPTEVTDAVSRFAEHQDLEGEEHLELYSEVGEELGTLRPHDEEEE